MQCYLQLPGDVSFVDLLHFTYIGSIKMHTHPFVINGLRLRFVFDPSQPVKFFDETLSPVDETTTEKLCKWAKLVEVQASGFDQDDHHGKKYTGTCPGGLLRYQSHSFHTNEIGPKLEIQQAHEGLIVTSHLQFLGSLRAFRSWTHVKNLGSQPILLEYVSTFALAGLSRGSSQAWDDAMRLHVADNTWGGEFQWRSGPLADFGFQRIYSADYGFGFSVNRLSYSNLGTWSTLGHLPLGALENAADGTTLFWQIEHNGSWHWEIGDIACELYLQLSGPTYREGHWSKFLQPGDSFQSVPATIGIVRGDFTAALRTLTEARRLIRRPHRDMEELPVIFNDYMNCLMGEPSTERLWPLIDRAAEIGSEYFVIDAGWYAHADQVWWDTVGEWRESESRFPNGLREVMDRIRAKGMIPGLWLEIEVVGVNCPFAASVPDEWFFLRDGRRVIDHGRYQLDFRHPDVQAHATEIIGRLIQNYGLGYIKMDYNINAGPGTNHQADSPGEGLLQHNRAYLDWLARIMDRHPALVIENCSSGGLRADYANLSLNTLQSTSDQMDYRLTAIIAAASASVITPEQAAVWSYPLSSGDTEQTVFNMVNTLLSRIHQSGAVEQIPDDQLLLVKEAISLYKQIRADIPHALPFWPLGLARFGADWAAYGLDAGHTRYLAVWRLSADRATIFLPDLISGQAEISVIYPSTIPTEWQEDAEGTLSLTLPQKYSARLLKITNHRTHAAATLA